MPDDHRLNRRRAIGAAGALAVTVAATRPATAATGPAPATFALDVSAQLPRRAPHALRPVTLAPIRAPHRFDLLGADWNSGARAVVEVRARQDRGGWSAWVPLAAAADHGPDRSARRDAHQSDPVWTGAADLVQLRVTGALRRLRLRFVRASPLVPKLSRFRAHAATQPAIIPRSSWGADRYPPREDPAFGDVQLAFVHHTVTANDYGPEDSAAMVLGILRYHRDHLGWNDIGYNFLVDKHGQIFEGRAGGVDQAVVGAQAQGWNEHSTGVACLGTFTGTPLSSEGIESVAQLLAWKLPLHGMPVTGKVTVRSAGGATNRYPFGSDIEFDRISGHRDGNATSCPGEQIFTELPRIRERATTIASAASGGLALRAERTTLTAGRRLVLTGTLSFTDGTPPADRTAQLEFQAADGQPWTPVRTAPVDPASGRFRVALPVTQSGLVRATVADDGLHGALESQPIQVTVLPKLALRISPRVTRRRRRVKLLGDVTGPAPARGQMIVERVAGRNRYRPVRRQRVAIRSGRVQGTFRPPVRGTYRATLRVAGQQIKRLVIAR